MHVTGEHSKYILLVIETFSNRKEILNFTENNTRNSLIKNASKKPISNKEFISFFFFNQICMDSKLGIFP